MGAIAVSGHPDAPDLFRKVLIASAAVPVIFPPVYLKVEADRQSYDEMQVDGAMTNQVFLYGAVLRPLKMREELWIKQARRTVRVFVIRNTQIKPHWKEVKPLIRSIGPRAVSSLMKAQGVGDLYRIYTTARRDGFEFNVAYIPDQLDTANRADEFDNTVMNVLFETGYELARRGYRWQKTPPEFFPENYEDTAAQ